MTFYISFIVNMDYLDIDVATCSCSNAAALARAVAAQREFGLEDGWLRSISTKEQNLLAAVVMITAFT